MPITHMPSEVGSPTLNFTLSIQSGSSWASTLSTKMRPNMGPVIGNIGPNIIQISPRHTWGQDELRGVVGLGPPKVTI